MTLFSLLWRNLLYFWRGNLAVMLGVLVGGTVLTGALLVGDSLQGSLRELTERRLGWVDHALVAPRFFRAELADEVAGSAGARVSPALLLQATASAGEKLDRRQARGITVLGVNSSFFGPAQPPDGFDTQQDRPLAWINRPTADALGVRKGDRFSLQLQKPEAIPRESGLGRKDVTLEQWELTVAGVLGEDDPGAAFNLRPELQAPRNVVVSLTDLQKRLGLTRQANALLAAGQKAALDDALAKHLTLDDWGLTLQTPARRAKAIVSRYDVDGDGTLSYSEWLSTRKAGKNLPRYAWVIEEHVKAGTRRTRTEEDLRDAIVRGYPYLALESKQLLLSPQATAAALEAAADAKLRAAPTIVYLCRLDTKAGRVAGVVAALDLDAPWPFGPFGTKEVPAPTGRQVVLFARAWDKAKQKPTAPDEIALRFKPPEHRTYQNPLDDTIEPFSFAGYLPPRDVAADPFLTPEFPGITDRDDVGAWDLPFDDPDWKKNVSKEYGDDYWKEFRGAPKAYVRLEEGKRMWGSSRFGELTSVRLALPDATEKSPPTSDQLEQAADRYRAALLKRLDPVAAGFVFDDVRSAGLDASQGGTPFGLLFLGFSFFLILSSLLLVGLLYRLNLERRSRQVGLLSAEGFPRSIVRQLLLGEGTSLALLGAAAGLLTAVLYSRGLVTYLAWAWPDESLRSLLRPHASAASMGWGMLGTLLAVAFTIWWVTRALSRVSPRALLAGQTAQESQPGAARASWWLPVVAAGALLAGAGTLVGGFYAHGQEAQAGSFFGAGMLFLTAGLCGVRLWMRGQSGGLLSGGGLTRLGVRNAARHPARSLLAVGLLASAVFLIVAVESFRRKPPAVSGEPNDATVRTPDGGFALMAESDLPLIRSPGTPAGRAQVLDRFRARLAEAGKSPAEVEAEAREAQSLLGATTIYSFRARAGDDASCLNLYKPRSPRVLGAPGSFLLNAGFVFDGSLAETPDEQRDPWRILLRQKDRSYQDGAPVRDLGIPAFGEKNTVQWMLRRGLGGAVEVPDEKGAVRELTVAGLLHDSVFQSSLIVSEEKFLELYPTNEGYSFFLIAPPRGREEQTRRVLELALADSGFVVTATRERLAAYLAVENTYLSTFQALGGLGLLLGSLGLSVVLLRAVWERRAELALLRALGYRRLALGWLVLAENAFLLLVGLVVGALSALLSILPQLARGEGSVPWLYLSLLFAGVLVVALSAAALATALTLRAPIVPALRRE